MVRRGNLDAPVCGDRRIRAQQRAEIRECLEYFEQLWIERKAKPGFDLVSMLGHGDATNAVPAAVHLGNIVLLIVGVTTPCATRCRAVSTACTGIWISTPSL